MGTVINLRGDGMSREKFEQDIKARFGDSIDYRVCRNSDGEYMAWDMQVAWWAWQAASKASEQQLAAVVAESVELKESVEHAASCIAAAEAEGLIDALAETTDQRLAGLVHRRLCHAYLEVKTPATDVYLAEVRSEVIEWLDAEITAIDTMYRGDPSYEHDAYWMKKEVLDLVESARKAFAAQLRQGAAL